MCFVLLGLDEVFIRHIEKRLLLSGFVLITRQHDVEQTIRVVVLIRLLDEHLLEGVDVGVGWFDLALLLKRCLELVEVLFDCLRRRSLDDGHLLNDAGCDAGYGFD